MSDDEPRKPCLSVSHHVFVASASLCRELAYYRLGHCGKVAGEIFHTCMQSLGFRPFQLSKLFLSGFLQCACQIFAAEPCLQEIFSFSGAF